MMTTATGDQLAKDIRRRMRELRKVCESIGEGVAGQSPAGRWSPKMILSHLAGPENQGHLPFLRMILDKDMPLLEFEMEEPYFTEARARMSLGELLSAVEGEYERMAAMAEGLSPEDLMRKAHVPMLKDTELGEYPTLGQMLFGIGDYHVEFHTRHMEEVAREVSEMPVQPAGTIPPT